MFNSKKRLDKLKLKTFRRIGDDFRKAGAITGAGIVGLILADDDIGAVEAFALIAVGVIIWCVGLYLEYYADRIELRSAKQQRANRAKKSK